MQRSGVVVKCPFLLAALTPRTTGVAINRKCVFCIRSRLRAVPVSCQPCWVPLGDQNQYVPLVSSFLNAYRRHSPCRICSVRHKPALYVPTSSPRSPRSFSTVGISYEFCELCDASSSSCGTYPPELQNATCLFERTRVWWLSARGPGRPPEYIYFQKEMRSVSLDVQSPVGATRLELMHHLVVV